MKNKLLERGSIESFSLCAYSFRIKQNAHSSNCNSFVMPLNLSLFLLKNTLQLK